jgi:hypothetical protein
MLPNRLYATEYYLSCSYGPSCNSPFANYVIHVVA